MSLKKDDSKVLKGKEKKMEQDKRSVSDQSSIKSTISSRENKLRPILISSTPGV